MQKFREIEMKGFLAHFWTDFEAIFFVRSIQL